MKSILSNKDGSYPVCRKTTQVSFIALPERNILKVSDGKPSLGSYEEKVFTL